MRVAFVLLGALTAGCHGSLPPPLATTPGAACSGDPCGAMVCPSGDRCTWNSNCQPRCEPQPLPTFSR